MRIKEIINSKGITSKELAAACGVSEMTISHILTGKSMPNGRTIIKMAEFLNVPCGALFDDYTPGIQAICPHCGKEIKIRIE